MPSPFHPIPWNAKAQRCFRMLGRSRVLPRTWSGDVERSADWVASDNPAWKLHLQNIPDAKNILDMVCNVGTVQEIMKLPHHLVLIGRAHERYLPLHSAAAASSLMGATACTPPDFPLETLNLPASFCPLNHASTSTLTRW